MPIPGFHWTEKPPRGTGLDPHHPMTRGLVAHWDFQGADALDLSPSGQATGTLVNRPAFGVGKSGQAITFNGANQYIACPDVQQFQFTAEFSIVTRMRSNFLANSTNYNIFSCENYGSSLGYRLYAAGYGGDANLNVLTLQVGDGVARSKVAGPQMTDLNRWYHVVATYNRGRGAIYVDGVRVAFATNMAPFLSPANSPAAIGRENLGGEHLRGSVDFMSVYGRELSATEAMSSASRPYGMYRVPIVRRAALSAGPSAKPWLYTSVNQLIGAW